MEEKIMTRDEQIALVCHQVNADYCLALGDLSQFPWDEAPEWQRESAINGVKFHRENPDAGPENSHESWLEEKRLAGWKYGLVKDAEKKEHPCFLPYNELPVEQRAKDYIFRATVHAMISLESQPTVGENWKAFEAKYMDGSYAIKTGNGISFKVMPIFKSKETHIQIIKEILPALRTLRG